MMRERNAVRFFNYHAPDTVRAFTVPAGSIRRWDDHAVVYDVRVGPDQILRHYSFPDRWFEVNCSMDLDGRFITEPGPVDWSFNCDICTPHFIMGDDLYNMDLWLDVLVAPDGRSFAVIDEDDFAVAVRMGWPAETERDGARAGMADLLGILRSEGLVSFLDRIAPFAPLPAFPQQPPMERLPIAQFPMLQPGERGRQYQHRLDLSDQGGA